MLNEGKRKPLHNDCCKVAEKHPADVAAACGQSESLSHLQVRLLSEIRVPVHVEIGELMLSAEEIIDLTGEQVFDLEFDPAKQVNLRIGDEVVAQGVLALCEDRLVVQVTAIGAGPSSKAGETQNRNPTTIEREEGIAFHRDYANVTRKGKEDLYDW